MRKRKCFKTDILARESAPEQLHVQQGSNRHGAAHDKYEYKTHEHIQVVLLYIDIQMSMEHRRIIPNYNSP